MILTTQWFGTFMVEEPLSEEGEVTVVSRILFPKKASDISRRLALLQSGNILEEERQLVEKPGTGEPGEPGESGELEGLKVDDSRLSEFGEVVERVHIDPGTYGYDMELLNKASILIGRESLRINVEKDRHVVQAIDLLDELNKEKNILCERLEEWYNIYFPEAVSLANHDTLVGAILKGESRESIALALGRPSLAPGSTGSDVSPAELKRYRALAKLVTELNIIQESTKKYIEKTMAVMAPNLTALAGPMVAARLVSLMGSLKGLAHVPASTIQVLGAEKALFRFLKGEGTPPKHGVIFMHPNVRNSPYWQRGKIARTFATKLSKAVKMDYFSGTDISAELGVELKRQISMIKKKYPRPPARKKDAPRMGRKRPPTREKDTGYPSRWKRERPSTYIPGGGKGRGRGGKRQGRGGKRRGRGGKGRGRDEKRQGRD